MAADSRRARRQLDGDIQSAAYAASADLLPRRALSRSSTPIGFSRVPLLLPRRAVRAAIRANAVRNGCLHLDCTDRHDLACSPATCRAARSRCSTIATPVVLLAAGRDDARESVEDYAFTSECRRCSGRTASATRHSCAPAISLRPTTSPCRRHCSRGSTSAYSKTIDVPKTSRSRRSRTSTSRPTRWA